MALEVAAAGGITRGELRRLVGIKTGAYVLSTATAVGTTTTLIDDINFDISTDLLKGRIIWCVTGHADNVGEARRITDSTRSAFSVTFTALDQATASGDTFEVWNSRGGGPTPQEVNDHLNAAIREAGDVATVGAVSTAVTFDATDPYIDIDASILLATGAQWEHYDDTWRTVPPADLEIDSFNRTVRIKNIPAMQADGRQVRLLGSKRSGLLTQDDHETGVPVEWITNHVASTVLLAASERVNDHRRDDYKSKSQYLRQIADAARPATVQPIQGGRRVRV